MKKMMFLPLIMVVLLISSCSKVKKAEGEYVGDMVYTTVEYNQAGLPMVENDIEKNYKVVITKIGKNKVEAKATDFTVEFDLKRNADKSGYGGSNGNYDIAIAIDEKTVAINWEEDDESFGYGGELQE